MSNVFGYLLRQPSHHDLQVHPALWTGSCFLDLVGACGGVDRQSRDQDHMISPSGSSGASTTCSLSARCSA